MTDAAPQKAPSHGPAPPVALPGADPPAKSTDRTQMIKLSEQTRANRLGNPRAELLAGLVVALALIPRGLYASFSIAVLTALVGGRPG
jgi:hypothetical protein